MKGTLIMTAETDTVVETDQVDADQTADENEATVSPTTPGTGAQRHQLPEGIVSPIAALNHLKSKGHKHESKGLIKAPQDFKPQQMYGFVKNPGKVDPFPVKHYDADGMEYTDAQVNDHGITTTRPGVKLAEVGDWWSRADERREAKAKDKKAKADAKAAKDAEKAAKAETTTATADGAEVTPSEGDTEFEDVAGEESE
jgi:hypothetical protein